MDQHPELSESTTFIETYLSNFGLLEAFQAMSGNQLDSISTSGSGGQAPLAPETSVNATLSSLSWSTMIPAVFHWATVPSPSSSDNQPYNFPTADGQTTYLTNQSISLNFNNGQNGPDGAWGVAAGNFFTSGGDNNLGLAVTNYTSEDVSILKGDGNGSFTTWGAPVSLDGPDGPEGIAVGNFINNQSTQDLAVADYSSDEVSILLGDGNGSFPTVTTVSLDGSDGPEGIAVGNFMKNSVTQDLAVADYSSNDVSILLGDGNGSFPTVTTVPLNGALGPSDIAVGDFSNNGNQDLAVTDSNSSEVTILSGNGTGSFGVSTTIPLSSGRETPVAITAADLSGDGNLDLAVAGSLPSLSEGTAGNVSILTNNGSGGWSVAQNISLNVAPNQITAIQLNGNIFPDLAVSYAYGVALLLNEGNGHFTAPVYYTLSGAAGSHGIVAGDFTGSGLIQLVVANYDSSNLNVVSGTTVGNFATFQPGSAILPELGTMQALQAGSPVDTGPIDETSQITPSTSSPPEYLGYISLPYYQDKAPLNIDSADEFLSVTPADMQQSATGADGRSYSYSQSGSIITGWDLFDSNGNPIAASTLQALFGVPVASTSGTATGFTPADLTPTLPSQPFAALNGGWYFAANPAPGAYATWADAFFNWGQGIAGYSPRNLIPQFDPSTGTGQQSGTLPGTSYGFPSDFDYTLTYSPEKLAPPGTGVAVNLASVFNAPAIVSDGTTFRLGVGDEAALSAQSLNPVLSFNNVLLDLGLPGYLYNAAHKVIGATNAPDAISAAGQTINLPGGEFRTLTLLGTAGREAKEQKFTVTYTDGTKQKLTQSMSDWTKSQNFPGETVVTTTKYRDLTNGTVQSTPVNVYGYTFKLESKKTVRSITLPENNDVMVLAMTLS